MRFLTSLVLAVTALSAIPVLSAQSLSDMSRTMMETYDKMLRANPKDYETYFARANEYCNQEDYLRALSDLNAAIECAPERDKETLYSALMLRGSVNDRILRYPDSYADYTQALKIYPDDYEALNRHAEMAIKTGNYSAARTDYLRIQRLDPRSPDAQFGLAHVAARQGNEYMANDYADQALKLRPTDGDSYMRRAEVRMSLGNHEGAADDYVTALSYSENGLEEPVQKLADMSYINYPAVNNALTRAIKASPKIGTYYYIRAIIATAHFHYAPAISDLDKIIINRDDSYAELNSMMAECLYALGQYDAALANVEFAISDTEQNLPYYVIKAQILNAMKDHEQALAAARGALIQNPDHTPALVQKALAQLGLGKTDEAAVTMAEAMLNEPDNASNIMLRAWLLKNHLNRPDQARELYKRVIDLDFDPSDVESLRGFALLFEGETAAADAWMNALLVNEPDYDGLIHYYATCYYAQKGDFDRALQCMATSLDKGYANYHNWIENTTSDITVAPLRSDPRFQRLINNHLSTFNR